MCLTQEQFTAPPLRILPAVKAILGPFALPFTVVEVGTTLKIKGEALAVGAMHIRQAN
jgi:hypothetical protein